MPNPPPPQVFVFCCDGLDPLKVDADFEQECNAAQERFRTAVIDHDQVSQGSAKRAVRLAGHHEQNTCAVYRGWMLTVDQYESLYQALLPRGLSLINDPCAYKLCHWLPEGYALIERHTPESRWIPISELFVDGQVVWPHVFETASAFGSSPLILKDYVKSQKHHWDQACFIPCASDKAAVQRVVESFLSLQGDDLAGGLVFRRHVPLRSLGSHPRSGMPIGQEYRLFFAEGKLLISSCYWEVGQPLPDIPLEEFEAIAKSIPSRFFSMDVAQGMDGRWWVIELGDGQVAGLPPQLDAAVFYRAVHRFWKSGVPDDAWEQIVAINDALVDGKFEQLAKEGRTGRCTPEGLQRVIAEYGQVLVRLPPEARQLVHVVARRDGSIAVDIPLWAEDEGETDLVLQVECLPVGSGWSVVIHDLLVP